MGEGEQRRSKRSARHSSRELAVFSKKNAPGEADWDARVATGTKPIEKPILDPLLGSRTTTVDDPLTTSLLAEVARRSRTIEVSSDQIDEATDLEPAESDDDPAGLDDDRDDDDPDAPADGSGR